MIQLRTGEEFECSMKAVIAVGELDAIFNASNAYYDEITENKRQEVVIKQIEIKTDPLPRLTILKGVVSDEISKKPLDAAIEIIDNDQNKNQIQITRLSLCGISNYHRK